MVDSGHLEEVSHRHLDGGSDTPGIEPIRILPGHPSTRQ